jgi:dolichol-phosphate mannosyltransferase
MRQRTSRATSTFNILDFRFSGVQLLRHGLNDTTNAFKAYRKTCLDGLRPFLSPHFNLTAELPSKLSFTATHLLSFRSLGGIAKLKIREMGSRYLFIVLSLWLEKYFSRGDYAKTRSAG